MKGDMAKGRRVPEDLMGTILRESKGPPGGEREPLESAGTVSWEDQPWLVGTTFNLSKQVGRELDRLRLDLQRQDDIHTSNSEIAEVALRIAIEDTQGRGKRASWSEDWSADGAGDRLIGRKSQARRPGAAWTARVTSSRPPTTREER
jgi:hypothetical protein